MGSIIFYLQIKSRIVCMFASGYSWEVKGNDGLSVFTVLNNHSIWILPPPSITYSLRKDYLKRASTIIYKGTPTGPYWDLGKIVTNSWSKMSEVCSLGWVNLS